MEPYKLQMLFLRLMSYVYLVAFASLYHQIPGLYGDSGLMPIRSMLRCDTKNYTECALFGEHPTALHWSTHFKLTPVQGMEVLCILGIVFSILSMIFCRFRDTFLYLALWFGYFSCFQVGQTFLWFQWDTLLLEAGFLAILVAPCKLLRSKTSPWLPSDNVTLFLVRWLAFRLMFASGVVKLTSECPTWWGLTALNYHFETQCIPNEMAWYAHQTPEWFRRLSVVGTYVIEIFIPILFLLPIKHLRKFAFWNQFIFMVFIMATGNYNFFNILTIGLCLPLLIESNSSSISTHVIQKKFPKFYSAAKWLMITTVYSALAYITIKFFSLRLVGFTIQSEIAFTKSQFYDILSWTIPTIMIVGCLSFALEVVTALMRCIVDFSHKSVFTMLRVLVQCIIVCSVCIVMFAISLVPLSYLDQNTFNSLWSDVKSLHAASDKFQLTHSYGLFRSMTGVDGRPEVILEGAHSLDGPWREYEFLYKPGLLNKTTSVIVPHQPRLDWQMWFAALGSYERNPWFISLVHKLLKNESEVNKLLLSNPFHDKPPKYVRAQLYHYYFTSYFPESKNYHKLNWWHRKFQHEYMPPISLDNQHVIDYLRNKGLLIEKPQRPVKSKMTRFLRILRNWAEYLSAPMFLLQMYFTVELISFIPAIVHR